MTNLDSLFPVIRLRSRYGACCGSYLELKILFQAHSDYWQNSVTWGFRTEVSVSSQTLCAAHSWAAGDWPHCFTGWSTPNNGSLLPQSPQVNFPDFCQESPTPECDHQNDYPILKSHVPSPPEDGFIQNVELQRTETLGGHLGILPITRHESLCTKRTSTFNSALAGFVVYLLWALCSSKLGQSCSEN